MGEVKGAVLIHEESFDIFQGVDESQPLFCAHDEQGCGKGVRIHDSFGDYCCGHHTGNRVSCFWIQDVVITGAFMLEIFLIVTGSGDGFS